jgi:hypothetical protein
MNFRSGGNIVLGGLSCYFPGLAVTNLATGDPSICLAKLNPSATAFISAASVGGGTQVAIDKSGAIYLNVSGGIRKISGDLGKIVYTAYFGGALQRFALDDAGDLYVLATTTPQTAGQITVTLGRTSFPTASRASF